MQATTPLQKITAAGLRVTPARKTIITSLEASQAPVSILELAAITDVDQATIYRNITPLLAAGVLEAISVSTTETKYALAHGHHDHIVCTNCKKVEHVQCAATTTPKTTSFTSITHHEITYFGICDTCS